MRAAERIRQKGDKTMDNTVVQAVIWLSAGAMMYLFLRRRRKRRLVR
jgi:hypothetical protein